MAQFKNMTAVRSFVPNINSLLAVSYSGASSAFQLPAQVGSGVLLVNYGATDVTVRPGVDATIAVALHGSGNILVPAGGSVLLDQAEPLFSSPWVAVSSHGQSGILVISFGTMQLIWQQAAPDAGFDPLSSPGAINRITGTTRQVATAADIAGEPSTGTTISGFAATGTVLVAASTIPATVALSGGGSIVQITNETTAVAYFNLGLGDAAATATPNSAQLPAGAMLAINTGTVATQASVLLASGTGTVKIVQGTGVATPTYGE
jgi:hypothetical protein